VGALISNSILNRELVLHRMAVQDNAAKFRCFRLPSPRECVRKLPIGVKAHTMDQLRGIAGDLGQETLS